MSEGRDITAPTPERVRKPRTITVTDSEWALLEERAAAAGESVSSYIATRLTGPQSTIPVDSIAGAVERVERAVRVLYEVEAERLRQHSDEGALEAIERRANLFVDTERKLG